ncbi:NRDE family protein [Luedemannella helvata]|uniref:NRDE family protein n=1 Tax=Luedemannella helvata TaxID=349315 RepID=A0ABP4X9R1_9ACTN
MCTVLLRLDPAAPWPLLVLAVRDEYLGRPWDVPGRHWPALGGRLIGGRDRVSGGTWLAVDPQAPAVAAVLNGERLPMTGTRPTRGSLPLAVLDGTFDPAQVLPDAPGRPGYDGFHLLHATPAGARVWSWDGVRLTEQAVSPGDHVLVNDGLDAANDPLVPHLAPRLAAAASPDVATPGEAAGAWGAWLDLLDDGPLPPTDPRALLIRHRVGDRQYGSGSVTLVGMGPDGIRYDFCADPLPAPPRERTWSTVLSVRRSPT